MSNGNNKVDFLYQKDIQRSSHGLMFSLGQELISSRSNMVNDIKIW